MHLASVFRTFLHGYYMLLLMPMVCGRVLHSTALETKIGVITQFRSSNDIKNYLKTYLITTLYSVGVKSDIAF